MTEVVEGEEGETEEHPSDAWLGAIARGTMDTYAKNILHIPGLPLQAALQLATDIGEWACDTAHFGHVMSCDLDAAVSITAGTQISCFLYTYVLFSMIKHRKECGYTYASDDELLKLLSLVNFPPAYLCNVLAALGQSPSQQLSQLETLCRATQEQ